jgi:putative ABC transport system permease protein
MGNLRQDIHYTLRTMFKNKAFTLVVILLLALGVGVNTAVFSVVYGIMLRPLPFSNPERLYAVFGSQPSQNLSRIYASGPDFVDFHDQNHTFEQIAIALPFSQTMVGQDEPQILRCTASSPEFFPMLGVQPLLGRLFRPEEYRKGGGGGVILSYSFWQRQFNGDPNVINRSIHLGDDMEPIIGVMPALPDIYPKTDVWVAMIADLEFMKWRGNRFLDLVGKLKPGVSPQQAKDDLTAIVQRVPENPRDMRMGLVPLKKELIGNVSPILSAVMAAVGWCC